MAITAPTGVTAVPIDGGIQLTWRNPVSGTAISYAIETSTDGTTWLGTQYLIGLDGTWNDAADMGVQPGVQRWYRVIAYDNTSQATSAAVSATAPARTALGSVRLASVQVKGGTTVELRSNMAADPVITLGYSKLADGVGFTAIAVLATDNSTSMFAPPPGATWPDLSKAGMFAVPGDEQDLALVANDKGDIFVVGRDASTSGAILAQYFGRGGTTASPTNVWTAGNKRSQAIAGFNSFQVIQKIVATYDAGTGATPVPNILVVVRGSGVVPKGGTAFATLKTSAIQAGSGTLFIQSGRNPSWLPTPTTSYVTPAPSKAPLDIASVAGLTVVLGNGVAPITNTNGAITAYPSGKSPAGTVTNGQRVRVIILSPTSYLVLALNSANALGAWLYQPATPAYSASVVVVSTANLLGGTGEANWDAFLNPRTGLVDVYYLSAARTVQRVELSPVTMAPSAATSITTTMGPASSTNSRLKVPDAVIDDRRILVEAAAVVAGAQSLAVLDDRTLNVAPNAPALNARSNFDATLAAAFTWAFSDPNTFDTQSAYQLLIEKVSDGTTAFDSGKVTSTTATHNLTAATLTNGTAYRWKVRTYDAFDTVGPYSSYGTFTPSALGTLTITDPATDGAALNTNTYPVVWTYVQGNGFTQVQRRVRVTRLDTSAVILDTTMQAGTTLGYTITGLLSGIACRIDVDIINSNGQSPVTASRTFTSTFNSPMKPTFVGVNGLNYIDVTVANPAPVGSLPEATGNIIQRRLTGSPDPWTTVATVGYNGEFQDRQVASGTSYDYQVIAVAATGQTTSDVQPLVAPNLMGVWLHLVSDPAGTEYNYIYQSAARGVTFDVDSTLLQFIGRTFPVAEFGENEGETYKLGIKVPMDDEVGVPTAIGFLRARATTCYRDNRGRVVFGVAQGSVTLEDSVDGGTVIGLTFPRVDYSEGS